MEAVRGKILLWLAEEGLEARVEQVPIGVPIEWVILVQIPGTIKVNIAIQQPKGKDVIILSLGVMVSPEHRDLLSKLSEEDRLIISAGILKDLINVCPDCIIALQPSLENLQFINVSSFIHASSLTRESLISRLRLLTNMFNLIVTDINAALASKRLYKRPSETMVM